MGLWAVRLLYGAGQPSFFWGTTVHIDFDVSDLTITLPNAVRPLSWLSSGIEMGIGWLMGRGVNQWAADISDDGLVTIMKAEGGRQNLQFSRVTHLDVLVRKGFFPKKPDFDAFQIGRAGTVLAQEQLRPELSIDDIAYGLSDVIVGVAYKYGARKFRWAGSLERCQLLFDVGLSSEELERYMSDPQDYTDTTLVADMAKPPRRMA